MVFFSIKLTKTLLSHTASILNKNLVAYSRIYDDKEFLCISIERDEEDTKFQIEFENSCRHLCSIKSY